MIMAELPRLSYVGDRDLRRALCGRLGEVIALCGPSTSPSKLPG